MRMIRTTVTVAALAAALVSCGTAAPTQGAPATPADDVAAVEAVFRDYNQALVGRDFAAACAVSAPETVEALLDQVQQVTGQRPADCPAAFGVIYAVPGAAVVADRAAQTIEVQRVDVTGDDATVTWSADVQGQRPTVNNEFRRTDGQWRIVDTG